MLHRAVRSGGVGPEPSNQRPYGTGQLGVVEGNLAEHTVVPRWGGEASAIGLNRVRAQQIDHKFVDGGEGVHKVPRVFAGEAAFVDDGLQFIVSLCPEQLQACPPTRLGMVRRHTSTLNADFLLAKTVHRFAASAQREAGSDHRVAMKPTPSFEDSLVPLTTDLDIERRVDGLIGRATRSQLWLLFIDSEDVQLPQMMPISGLPYLPDDGAEPIFRNIASVMPQLSADAVIVVWERALPSALTARDAAWLQRIAAACRTANVRLRGMLLSHRTGVRWIPPDDYA